jgi:hypothetical protein
MRKPRNTSKITMQNQEKQYCDFYTDCNGCEYADSTICNTKTCTILTLHKIKKDLDIIDTKIESWKLTV